MLSSLLNKINDLNLPMSLEVYIIPIGFGTLVTLESAVGLLRDLEETEHTILAGIHIMYFSAVS